MNRLFFWSLQDTAKMLHFCPRYKDDLSCETSFALQFILILVLGYHVNKLYHIDFGIIFIPPLPKYYQNIKNIIQWTPKRLVKDVNVIEESLE